MADSLYGIRLWKCVMEHQWRLLGGSSEGPIVTLDPLRGRFIVGPDLQHLDQLRIVNDENDLFLGS